MPEKYDPKKAEKKWQQYREETWIYKYDFNSDKDTYSIDTPPPTVSGKIHIWHIFSYTQAEVIWRYHRMLWKNVFYPFWFDDNWLPTERLVEKEIWKKAVDLWRTEFSRICHEITEKYRNQFKELWQSMWLSVDWSLQYSTVSKDVQELSQKSFVRLLKKWLIIKKDFPALRCHECKTSVAQAEIDDKELDSVFYDIIFNLESWEEVVIATTRPELLPACVAVFVNPDDERHANLVWKYIFTPLWVKVKILADEKVQKDKWTWVVMCCSYWDETDMYWLQKYQIEEKIMMDENWHIKNSWVDWMDWLFIKKAKKFIVEKLKSEWKIISEKPIVHAVWTHERCGTPIEIITVWQWFIKILDYKKDLIEIADKINWNPDYMKKRYVDWVENLKWDWCISRQRYFWIPVPIWYSKKTWDIIIPDESELPIDPLVDKPKNLPEWHTADDIIWDSDVLDTWATSWLTPQINSHWTKPDSFDDKLMPMDLRPQAHDIIRTWAFYTILMSLFHRNDIPFKDVMISGHVLAWKGEKISKSKWNMKETPEELIEKYWADPIRYWACGWSLWKNIIFDENEIKNWTRLVTKLWNASNFVFMNLWDFDCDSEMKFDQLEDIDKWVLIKIQYLAEKTKKAYESFEFWQARIEFEKFFWSEYCDNYLEIVKDIIYKPENYEDWNKKKLSAQYALYNSLYMLLQLVSPILPHISEELYDRYYKTSKWLTSIHISVLPSWEYDYSDFEFLDWTYKKILFDVVDNVRKFKTDNWIRLWEQMEYVTVSIYEVELLDKIKEYVRSVWKIKYLLIKRWDNIEIG